MKTLKLDRQLTCTHVYDGSSYLGYVWQFPADPSFARANDVDPAACRRWFVYACPLAVEQPALGSDTAEAAALLLVTP